MENIYNNLTEDQLWENFEIDFFRCRKPDLFNRCSVLDNGTKRIFKDFVIMSHAIELTDYFWDKSNCFEEKLITGKIFIEVEIFKEELHKILTRNKINIKQKHLVEKLLRKLNASFMPLSDK